MTLLEVYLRALWSFLRAHHQGYVESLLPEEETAVCSLFLTVQGTWEIARSSLERIRFSASQGISVPLVLPLVPIILVAHVETQWKQSQPD